MSAGETETLSGSEHALEWLSLDDEESVLWAGGPDKRTMVPTAALLLLPVLSLAIIPFNTLAGVATTAITAVVIGPIVAWSVLWIRSTDFVVTSSGLYAKRGVLSRDVKRIDFGKVQNTSYSQSALGTRFGYGTVEVSSAGGSGVEMRFGSIPNPREIQQLISSRVSPNASRRSETARQTEPTRPDDEVLEEILTELRAIRAALENGAHGSNDREPDTGESDDSVTLEHDSTDSDS